MRMPTILGILLVAPVLCGALDTVDSLDLRESLERFRVINPDLVFMEKNFALQKSAWEFGVRAILPTLTLEGGQDERWSQVGSESRNFNLGVRVEQALWDGGRLMASRRLEGEALELGRKDLDRKIQGLFDQVVQGYRAIIAQQERITIQDRGYQQALKDMELVQVEASLGRLTDLEIQGSQLQLDGLYLDLQGSRLELVSLEQSFAALLELESLPRLTETIDPFAKTVSLDLDDLITMVMSGSLDLVIAEQDVKKRTMELRLVRQGWFPQFGFQGSVRVQGKSLPLQSLSWNLGLTVSFASPLLGGTMGLSYGGDGPGEINARTNTSTNLIPEPSGLLQGQGAVLALQQETEKLKKMRADLERSVRQSHGNFVLLTQRWEMALRRFTLATRQRDLVKTQFSLGAVKSSDLMNAELELNGKLLAVLEARIAIDQAIRALEVMASMGPGELLTRMVELEELGHGD